MSIRAVVFDIGGVLEITPRTGTTETWEGRLGLNPGELDARLNDVWRKGSIGAITEAEVHASIREIMGVSALEVDAFMSDIWAEYLGTPNQPLIDFFKSLRPRHQTAIISNSFVGAREREQALNRFEDFTDVIIYSHEVGLSKPDPRIFRLACERLRIQPAEMLFLDDVEPIVAAAVELGIHGVLYRNNVQAIAEIEARLSN